MADAWASWGAACLRQAGKQRPYQLQEKIGVGNRLLSIVLFDDWEVGGDLQVHD